MERLADCFLHGAQTLMSRLSKNIVYNALGQVLLLVLSFVAVKYVFRRLGADALGIIYFTITTTLLAVSLALIAEPILTYLFNQPIIQTSNYSYYIPGWAMPVVVAGGFLLLVVTMHVARGIGRLHGRYAKRLLVKTEK